MQRTDEDQVGNECVINSRIMLVTYLEGLERVFRWINNDLGTDQTPGGQVDTLKTDGGGQKRR